MSAPGDQIGPFRLVSQLGAGAMGEVWRARDERLDRYVALKLLPAELASDPERRARMLREARAAAAIRHHNVVTLFDIIEADESGSAGRGDILVLELVEGRTLSDALRKDGKPPLETALRWLEGVCDALVAAHARRILHRDIKAANIMLTPDGGIKVLDFGLAKFHEGDGTLSAAASTGSMSVAAIQHRVALDETMPSSPGTSGQIPVVRTSEATLDSYATHAGSLLGTPIYMAPEQIGGSLPDARSEVFSVGVLAYELFAGKPPYTATTLDALFLQITKDDPPPIAELPASLDTVLRRALAKEPASRIATMRELRDAFAAERKRLFTAPTRRWPLFAALGVALVGAVAVAVLATRSSSAPTPAQVVARPGDEKVKRALEEYNVFFNEKALSSLRAALREDPRHPRATAYMILFGGAPGEDRTAAITAAGKALSTTAEHTKDRALLEAALAYTSRGAAAAKSALLGAGAPDDRELRFWAASLDWRSGDYAAARDAFAKLLDEPAPDFRGRIYDQYSALLLYFDEPTEALRIGTLYRDAFPGEADAVAVYATTLAAAGKLDEAVAAAEDALRLAEGEDTLAGLGKVLALRNKPGDRARAKDLYRQSIERAGASRRPIRRAALAFLQWIDGESAFATDTVKPCLPGGADASVRERGQCLFVAGIVEPGRADEIVALLEGLAVEAVPTMPAYGYPRSLAALVRTRAAFFGGACVRGEVTGDPRNAFAGAYNLPRDFYASYHIPLMATWSACEQAAQRAATGDKAAARAVLEPIAAKAPGRWWIEQTLAKLR